MAEEEIKAAEEKLAGINTTEDGSIFPVIISQHKHTGGDTPRVSYSDLADRPSTYIEVRCLANTVAHTVDTNVVGALRLPDKIRITSIGAYVDSAGTTGSAQIDINDGGTSILSTKITIDSGEESTKTATILAVISDKTINADSAITFDIDTIQSTAASGLVVWLKYL